MTELHFEKLNLSHLDTLRKAVSANGRITCQLSAASLYCYAEKYSTEISICDKTPDGAAVYIRQRRPGFGICYLCPIVTPPHTLAEALKGLFTYHTENEQSAFQVWGVTDEITDEFLKAASFCNSALKSWQDRDWAEYIHARESLIDMRGKNFHAKRNAVNHFIRNNSDYSYEALTPANLSEASGFQQRLLTGTRKFETDEAKLAALIDEDKAITRGFEAFSELRLEGGLIRIDGEISAFAFGGAINANSFDIVFEKALRIQGLFQVLEQEMLKNNLRPYDFINREEDLGDPGMRAAKERLRPDRLLMKEHFSFA